MHRDSDEVVGHYWRWLPFAVRDIRCGLLMRSDLSCTRVDYFVSFFLESRINVPACLIALPPACQISHISSINLSCPMSPRNYHSQSFVISWLCAALLNILFIKGINNYGTAKLLRPERHWGFFLFQNVLSLYSIILHPELGFNQILCGISLRQNITFYGLIASFFKQNIWDRIRPLFREIKRIHNLMFSLYYILNSSKTLETFQIVVP